MITVLTGTQDIAFDRLIRRISEGWANLDQYGPVFIQAGTTVCREVPESFHVFDFCNQPQIDKLLRDSTFCITHAGTGSIIGALTAGCKVAVMPRLKAYGEHNDDHQTEIAELFESTGLVVYWRDAMSIGDLLERLELFDPRPYKSEFEGFRAALAKDVSEFLAKWQ